MHSLDVNIRQQRAESEGLMQLIDNMISLDPRYQKTVAELVMIRLFSMLEEHFQSITLKVLCGALYLDNTAPTITVRCRSMRVASTQIANYGRSTPLQAYKIKWNQAVEIRNNVRYMLPATENLITVFDRHATLIDDMRRVRNHIAHNNVDTARKYKLVVQRHYGAFASSITPSVLLISNRRNPILIKQYLIASRIIIKELVRG